MDSFIPKKQSDPTYYNLVDGRIFINGFRDSIKNEIYKILKYPNIPSVMYSINQNGNVYSNLKDEYISKKLLHGKYPSVILSCVIDGVHKLEPFYVKDLVACSFIDNSISYLERGYRVVNIDGDPMNCNYRNLIYIL